MTAACMRWALDALAERGVLAGVECGEGLICPDEPLKRWEMAVWLVRLLDGADPGSSEEPTFADVDYHAWWAPFVERLLEMGVTVGCGTEPARYCPDNDVTRAQMATFLTRAFDLEPVPQSGFIDTAGSVHAADIHSLAAAGVTLGCGRDPLRFCPNGNVTRAQMASFLARALGLIELPASVRFMAVDAGHDHSCALRIDNTVACWGGNVHGQADAPDGEFKAVSAGGRSDRSHSCGVRADGTVACWGANNVGQTDAPDGQFRAISAGGTHSCGVRVDGTVACWGWNRYGQLDAPGGEFVMISTSGAHSCGVRVDGTVACWGLNNFKQTDAPGGEFVTVSAGSAHSCGVRVDGTVACWGADPAGLEGRTAPSGQFIAVSAGGWLSCGLRVDRRVVCWGLRYRHQAAPDGEFKSVSVGLGHSCGIRVDGRVVCWGIDHASPGEAPVGQFTAVVAGAEHACGLRVDRAVVCWGRSFVGEAHAPPGQFSAISGGEQSCGVRVDGTVACWGGRFYRQADATRGKFRSVTSSNGYSCGLRADDTVVCWGMIDFTSVQPIRGPFDEIAAGGRFACGLRPDHTIACWTPVPEAREDPPDGRFDGVSVGGAHGCGLRSQGAVACWGDNSHGQVDAPDGRFTAVSAGGEHSCGLRADTTVECWGDNSFGQTDVPAGQFKAIAAGSKYSCGVHASGAIHCWGSHSVVPPVGVRRVVGPLRPDPNNCRPFGTRARSPGFPLSPEVPSTTGRLRVAVLFVDFPGAEASTSSQPEGRRNLGYVEQYIESASYGALRIEFVPLRRWLRAEHGYQHYMGQSIPGRREIQSPHIDREAVRLADPHFDFSEIDAVMIVMPSAHFGGGNARGYVDTEEGSVSTLRINTVPGRRGSDGGRLATHELAHNLGLGDLYPFTGDRRPAPPPDGKAWRRVELGLMGLASWVRADQHGLGQVDAAEMLAWSRWQLGWLGDDQIRCIREPTATVELSPVADPGHGVAMAAVPLSSDEMIVVESRRRIGYDERAAWGNGAVVVYTVDAWTAGGNLPVRLAGDVGRGYTRESPVLAEGESVTVRGYTVTVVADDGDTHTVTVTRNGDR